MEAEKFRNLTDAELEHQQRELNDQLFRLKFQLKMGQTESLNKIRGLRKDVARIHTVIREKQLGIVHQHLGAAVLRDVGHLRPLQPRAHRHGDRAQAQHGEVGGDELEAVLATALGGKPLSGRSSTIARDR